MKIAASKTMLTFSLLVLGLFLNGCVNTMEIKPIAKNLPELFNVQVNEQHVKFQVISNGCTQVEDFAAQVVENTANPQWQIVRLKPDWCKRKSFKASFEINLPATGLTKEKLLNKNSRNTSTSL